MYDSDEIEDEFRDIFKEHHYTYNNHGFEMKGSTIAYVVLSSVAIFILLCWCCRRRRSRGQVLSPPVQTIVIPPGQGAPYPQQTYAHAAPYHGAPYPNATTASPYPSAGASYPTGGAPYPTGGAPYPTGGAPYPTGGAPYPTGGAPYPTMGGPAQPGFTVTPAPPPSYNEAVAHEAYSKQSPYNPSYPHS